MHRNRAFVSSQVSQWRSNVPLVSLPKKLYYGASANFAADSAQDLKNIGVNQSGNYWIKINGTPTLVYCDMVNDGGGWMLYTSFASDNSFDSGFPAINGNRVLVTNFAARGYSLPFTTNYSDGVNGSLSYGRKAEYFAHFYSSGPLGIFEMNSYVGPTSCTQMRIKHGGGSSDFSGADGNLYTNGSLVYSAQGGGLIVTSVVSFNPIGTTPILKQEETGIAGISWIFVR